MALVAYSNEIESSVTTCTSDGLGGNPEPQPSATPLANVESDPSSGAAGLKLGDAREPLSAPPEAPPIEGTSEGSITPMGPTEENTDIYTTNSTCVLPQDEMLPIGVQVLLREVSCLSHRVAFVEAVVEPLKRGTIQQQSGSQQPAMARELDSDLKQLIKDSAELMRVINGNFSRLGEKLHEWIPLMGGKVYAYNLHHV